MIKLFKALILPKIKTLMILVLTGVIVMVSVHTNGSLNGSDLEIIRRLDENYAPHATVLILDIVQEQSDVDRLLDVLNEYKSKGVRYTYESFPYFVHDKFISLFTSPSSLGQSFFHSGGSNILMTSNDSLKSGMFQTLIGKKLSDLEKDEVAIPYHLLEDFGFSVDDVIGQTIKSSLSINLSNTVYKGIDPMLNESLCEIFPQTEGCYESFYDIVAQEYPLTVAAVTQELRLSNTENEFDPKIDFFKPDREATTPFIIMNEETLQAIPKSYDNLAQEVHSIFEQQIKSLPYFNETLDRLTQDLGNQLAKEDFNPKDEIVSIFYDDFSKKLEEELSKSISDIHVRTEYEGVRSGFKVDTLTSKMDKEPMVTSVLKVLSNYVLLGVLLSSFYSFYIHFKNQIRTSTKEISALLMQGIPWFKISIVYLLELLLIFTFAYGIFVVVSIFITGFNVSPVLYSGEMILFLNTTKWSILFFLVLSLIVLATLVPFRYDVLNKFKKASQTHLSAVGLSSNGFIKELSLKRAVKYVASTLGFSFSISLVVAIIVLSLSSSFHLKNLYSKETFGIQFDYMIRHSDLSRDPNEVFALSQKYASHQAQLVKTSGIMFMDHGLWQGNSNYYKSSEIAFINEIEPFVPLQSGKYPTHYTDLKGEEVDFRKEALVSRRHLDRRNIGKSNSVENRYLFFFADEQSSYEQAYEIHGKVNALYNNGWTVSTYWPIYVSPGELVDVKSSQYVLNLKEGVDPVEFEALLDEENIDYMKYDVMIDDFQAMNDSMNETALLISMAVSILMFVLLSINVSGLVLSAKMEVRDDDRLFKHLGVSAMNIRKVNGAVLILRMLLSIAFLFVLIVIVYPPFFNDLLSAFGLFSMPGSIILPFIMVSLGILLLLMCAFLIITKSKKIEGL